MAKPDRGNINRMLYTAEDAAGLLGVDAPWLRRKATTGAIPCTFLGTHLRFSDTDLEAIARPQRPYAGHAAEYMCDDLGVAAVARRIERRDERRARAQWREAVARAEITTRPVRSRNVRRPSARTSDIG